MRLPGFEPGSDAPQAPIIDQPIQQPLGIILEFIFINLLVRNNFYRSLLNLPLHKMSLQM